jgi:hypothetical protein
VPRVQLARAAQAPIPSKFPFQLTEWLAIRAGPSNGIFHMTFIIEATKDDHRTVDFRSTAIVAVILARKLVAEGFAVSITAPSGHLYLADQFNLLLTSKSLSSQAIADDG